MTGSDDLKFNFTPKELDVDLLAFKKIKFTSFY